MRLDAKKGMGWIIDEPDTKLVDAARAGISKRVAGLYNHVFRGREQERVDEPR